ncbi:hypothetical protein MCOR27_000246 [Pyricularia oryzae]|uniref:Uncharacterized protein n=5 Tax=Pyricularia TaxID=48558 RepID=A0ABQ8N4W9_PYRGI|nr:uncharacterized protein MGG_14910 [Pyricularia oryzae 70-15]ELQ41715.1 hypothetical protein OOU_Y34scaffold00255g13 [Pyricularia oryzae Y34]KAH8845817.1 hypothetical protein MCOR01_003042 [Pyricularia oryzae]KAI6291364.1 hypothetical protein MCOR33_010678 [Pyricularia grisea]EHA47313.1 hypothetical protein MGG_14910 [Pyricularia oryzae 70-15]KAH9432678.1 hypothetical protein MCOR02_007365 [Pyricularia oryzae]
MKSNINLPFSGHLLALTIGSQAFAEQTAAQSTFGGKDSISSLAPAASNAVEISMETKSPVVTLGPIPAMQIFESLTDWTSTVTATTTVTTMTTTIMVPRPTTDMPFSPTTNIAGRAKPVVGILGVVFGLTWAAITL